MKLVEIYRPGHFMREDIQRKYSHCFPTFESVRAEYEHKNNAKLNKFYVAITRQRETKRKNAIK